MIDDPTDVAAFEAFQRELEAPEEGSDAAALAQFRQALEVEGKTFAELGIDLSPADLREINDVATSRPGFMQSLFGNADARDVPFLGGGASAAQLYELQQAAAAMQSGTATPEQKKSLYMAQAEALRDPTWAGGVGEMLRGMGTLGAEFGLTMGVGAAARGTGSLAIGAARKELLDQMVKRTGEAMRRRVGERVAGALSATAKGGTRALSVTGAQQAVPQFFGDDGLGAWDAAAARRAFADWEMTDDEAAMLASALNEELPKLLESKVSRWKGFQELLIQNSAEQAGGALVRIPGISYLQAAQTRVVKRLAGEGDGALGRAMGKMADAAAYDGPLAETLEELVSGMAVEGAMGESFIDGLPDDFEELTQLIAASSMPTGVSTAVRRMRAEQRMRLPSRQAALEAQQQAPGAERSPASGATPTQEGGDAISPGEATVETAGVEPGVSSEQRQADVDSFAAAIRSERGTDVALKVVEPETQAQAEAQRLMERAGIQGTFVRAAEGAQIPAGFFPGEGRAVINADSGDVQGAALHEAWHTWEAQQAPEAIAELEAELEAMDAGLVSRIRAVTEANPLLAAASPDLRAEEGRATRAQLLAPLVSYLDTPQGAADFARVYTEQPGAFRRTLEAIWDFIASRVPMLPVTQRRAAQQRLEAARGALPGTAPQLASRLLDALDDIRPAMDAPAEQAVTETAQEAPSRAGRATAVGQSPLPDAFSPLAAPQGGVALPEATPTPAPPQGDQRDQTTAEGRTPMPGDRVVFMNNDGTTNARSQLEAEVLETTGSGGNTRHRIRIDGGSFGNASRNRKYRGDRERIVDRGQLRLIEAVPMEALDPTSRRVKNRTRAEREMEEGADPRFASEITPEQRAELEAEGLAAPFTLGTSFAEEAELSGVVGQVLKRVSDEFQAVAEMVKAARKFGADLSSNPESAVRRFFGKIAHRGEKIDQEFVQPLVKALAASGVTIDQAGDHVMARHVPEANAEFVRQWEQREALQDALMELRASMRGETRNQAKEDEKRALERRIQRDYGHLPKRLPDGVTPEAYFNEVDPLSGMKTSEAQALVKANMASEQAEGYRQAGLLVDQLNRQTRDRMLEDGLITPEQHAQWSTQFKHYVPLRSNRTEGALFPARGSGFQIRGPESKRRKGRRSKADNPITFSLQQALRAIERGEKNQVGQEFLDFARKNAALMELDVREDLELDEAGKPALTETEFHLKVDGRDVAINVKDQELADAMRRVQVARIPKGLRLYGKVQGVWRGLVTSYSPEFILSNAWRDVQTALLNAQSVQEEFDLKDLRKSMRGYLAKSARATWQWRRGSEDTTGLRDRIEEYSAAGGRIGTFTSPDFEQQTKNLERDLKNAGDQSAKGKAFRGLLYGMDVVEDANMAVETAARFALYNSLRDRGVSAADAALAARQLTTDFSQKGTWGSMASLLYVFASAAVGGNRRLLQELLRSKKSQGFAAGLVGYGFASAYLNEMLSDEDEDGLSIYSKIPEYEKARYHIIMIPGMSEPLKVPMPYGWSIFPALGRLAAEHQMGRKSAGRASRDLLFETFETFNPVGASPSFAQLAAPTFLDPFVQVAENKNFAGSPIRPQDNPFGPDVANHRRAFRSTYGISKDAARAINAATGGDDVEPGLLNPGGDDIEHLLEFFGGGTSRFIIRTGKAVRDLATGEFTTDDLQTAPFIRTMYGSRTEFTDQARFYEGKDDIAKMKLRIKDAEQAGEREKVAELQRRHGPALRLEKRHREVSKQVKELKDQAYAKSGKPDQDLLNQATRLQQAWVKDYLVAVGKVKASPR